MVRIRPLALADAPLLLAVRLRSRAFLEPWEPLRDERWFTLGAQEEHVRSALREAEEGRALPFAIEADGALVGGVNLNVLVRGVFDNAYLGYWLDEAHGGRGIATEAVRQAVTFAFGPGGLHRVQAAVIPRNAPSLRLLEKLGFREEGFAERYLRINGTWEDHRLFALTREEWRG